MGVVLPFAGWVAARDFISMRVVRLRRETVNGNSKRTRAAGAPLGGPVPIARCEATRCIDCPSTELRPAVALCVTPGHTASMSLRARPGIGLALRLGGAAAALGAFAYLMPWRTLPAMLPIMGVGFAVYIPFGMAKMLRWHLLLGVHGIRMGPGELARSYLAGLAFGAVTPGRAGELARVAEPVSRGHPLGPLLTTIVTDRLLDLSAICAVALLVVWPGGAPESAAPALVATAAFALFAWFVPAGVPYVAHRWFGVPSDPARIGIGLRVAAAGCTAASMACYFSLAAAILGAAGISTGFWHAAAALAAGNLAALLPVTIGGLGTREGAIAGVLAAGGVRASAGSLAAFAAAFHAVFTAAPFAYLGLLWLVRGRRSETPG